MHCVSLDYVHDSLPEHVDRVIAKHEPLNVTRHNDVDFIVVGAEWQTSHLAR